MNPDSKKIPSVERPTRAAIYLRMSTENQNYSMDHQRAAIAAFAISKKLVVVREYSDEGKSGLDIRRRVGLQKLMLAVQTGEADFKAIIVYDVSRWGRFQDVDEAGYHEHTCRRAGVQVLYCAEQFSNDGTPLASLLKSIKRTMAAEYSRELSTKVFRAQCRFTEMGFKQGGHAGLGLRRQAISEDGRLGNVMEFGEMKRFITDRVILILGPQHERDTVTWIYEQYVNAKSSEAGIARELNAMGVASEFGRPWTQTMVNSILTNQKYVGRLVFNRRSCKLSSLRTKNDRGDWVVVEGALPCVVSPATFQRAQEERSRRNRRYSEPELLILLIQCFARNGRVTADIIAKDRDMPDPQLFVRCFGSLVSAYDKAGIPRTTLHKFVDTKASLLRDRERLFRSAWTLAIAGGAKVRSGSIPYTFVVNDWCRVLLVVAVQSNPVRGCSKWKVEIKHSVDFIIVARTSSNGVVIIDYFLLPASTFPEGSLYLKDADIQNYSMHHYCKLEALFSA